MNAVGELSAPGFSPHKRISEVALVQVRQMLLQAFTQVGRPQAIKVDNGRPFGDPRRETIPVLALWLIALGIKVVFNRVRVPQDNAKVERMQGVLANWIEWKKCPNTKALQQRLDREANFHNTCYKVSRLKYKTRVEAFPNLLSGAFPFDPSDFDAQRAIDFVAMGHWERVVSKGGQFSHWGQRIQVKITHAHEKLSLRLNPLTNQWEAFEPNGELIIAFDSKITKENLWKLDLS